MKKQFQIYLYIPLLSIMLFSACDSGGKANQSEDIETVTTASSHKYLPPFMSSENELMKRKPERYTPIPNLSFESIGIITYQLDISSPLKGMFVKGIYFYGFKIVRASEIRLETTASGYSFYAKRRDDRPEVEVLRIDKSSKKIYCRNYNTFNPNDPMLEISKEMVDDKISRATKIKDKH